MLAVGNDLVDLSLDENRGKETDRCFLDRVLCRSELSGLNAATDPKRRLWALWAAKETAFKIGSKLHPGLVFSSRFRVSFEHDHQSGLVLWDQGEARVWWDEESDWIHCVGLGGEQGGTPDLVRTRVVHLDGSGQRDFSASERASFHSNFSAEVRTVAKALLLEYGIVRPKIIRAPVGNKYGPPVAFSNGKPVPRCDLSLSHHGGYVAAAVCLVR